MPGCENHGQCLVDAHGGILKPKAKKADLQNKYPSSTLAFEAFVEKIPNTYCFVMEQIDYEWVEKEWYGPYTADWKLVAGIKGINSTGQITFPFSANDSKVVGWVLTRSLYERPESWPHASHSDPRLNRPVPDNHTYPGWIFHNVLPPPNTKFC